MDFKHDQQHYTTMANSPEFLFLYSFCVEDSTGPPCRRTCSCPYYPLQDPSLLITLCIRSLLATFLLRLRHNRVTGVHCMTARLNSMPPLWCNTQYLVTASRLCQTAGRGRNDGGGETRCPRLLFDGTSQHDAAQQQPTIRHNATTQQLPTTPQQHNWAPQHNDQLRHSM